MRSQNWLAVLQSETVRKLKAIFVPKMLTAEQVGTHEHATRADHATLSPACKPQPA